MKLFINVLLTFSLLWAGDLFGAASSSSSSAAACSSGEMLSYFALRRDRYIGEFEKILHPILHGIADKGDGFFPELWALGEDLGVAVFDGYSYAKDYVIVVKSTGTVHALFVEQQKWNLLMLER